MYDYKAHYDNENDTDDDHMAINVLQDAGPISEAIAASDGAPSFYDLPHYDKADVMIELMTGGFSAGFTVHVLAEHLENINRRELDAVKNHIEQKLMDGALTDAKRQELNDFLQMLETHPELLEAKK